MKRDELIEKMARAAWECPTGWESEDEKWESLPDSIRSDWIGYARAALDALEDTVPNVRMAIDELADGG